MISDEEYDKIKSEYKNDFNTSFFNKLDNYHNFNQKAFREKLSEFLEESFMVKNSQVLNQGAVNLDMYLAALSDLVAEGKKITNLIKKINE